MSADLSTNELREKRRQKILLNSEQRMKKLLGQEFGPEHDVSTNDHTSCIYDVKSGCARNGLSNNEMRADLRTDDEINTSASHYAVEADDPIRSCTYAAPEALLHRRSINLRADELGREPIRRIDSIQQSEPAAESVNLAAGKTVTSESTPDYDQKSWKGLRSVLVLLLGFLVRLAFQTNFGILYIQTMVVPFLTAEIAIFYYERSTGATIVRGTLSYLSALQLYGVSPDAVRTCQYVMMVIFNILEDFCFYLFAFVVLHSLI